VPLRIPKLDALEGKQDKLRIPASLCLHLNLIEEALFVQLPQIGHPVPLKVMVDRNQTSGPEIAPGVVLTVVVGIFY